MVSYGKMEFWNQRYGNSSNPSPCEWYRSYGHLRHLLNPIYFATANGTTASLKGKDSSNGSSSQQHPKKSPAKAEHYMFPARDATRILIVGCGNSSFGADMLRDGWGKNIINVDFSSVVIDQMRKQFGDHFYKHLKRTDNAKLEFHCADITKALEYTDGSFDLIVCKGTMDAVLCAGRANALAMVKECARLLAPGHGIFFVVTNGNPDSRLEYLEREHVLTGDNAYWRGVSVHLVEHKDKKNVYCYICRRCSSTVTGDKENCRS